MNFINQRSMKKAIDVRKQITSYLAALNLATSGGEDFVVSGASIAEGTCVAVLRSLCAGLFFNVAVRGDSDHCYRTAHGGKVPAQAWGRDSRAQEVYIHPSSVLAREKAPQVVYDELVRWRSLHHGCSALTWTRRCHQSCT